MLKKIYQYVGVLTLLLFSFYYTDKAVDIVKRNDPVMKSIIEVKDKYAIESVSAFIDNDTIIPGMNGIEVNIDESYKKMKKVNGYYESMLIFSEVIPEESVLKQYDKFIVQGNPNRSDVAILIKGDTLQNLEKAYEIFLEKDVLATFFVDGTLIEDNMDLMYKIASRGFQLENFGYNDIYDEAMFSWTNNMIYSLTNQSPQFCYVEYNNYDILNLCKKNQMYTVRPTTIVKSNPFYTVKETLKEGSIISLNLTSETMRELPTIISYIKQKGYNIVTLSEVVSEKRDIEK